MPLRTGSAGFTTSVCGPLATIDTGAKSRTGW
jgi:hypothetical protein